MMKKIKGILEEQKKCIEKKKCKNCGHEVFVTYGNAVHRNREAIDGRGYSTELLSIECNIKGCECKRPDI